MNKISLTCIFPAKDILFRYTSHFEKYVESKYKLITLLSVMPFECRNLKLEILDIKLQNNFSKQTTQISRNFCTFSLCQ